MSLIREKDNGLNPLLIAAYHQEPALADFLAEKAVNLTIFEAAATGKTGQIVRQLARDPNLVNAFAEQGGHTDASALLKEGITRRFRTKLPGSRKLNKD